MLSVIRVHLPSEIPIVGCESTPYVLVRRPDTTTTTDDISESAPLEGHFLRYRWYRIENDRKASNCSVHPSEVATLQCVYCSKTKSLIAKSYHCSGQCFVDSWKYHRILHERAAKAIVKNENDRNNNLGPGRFPKGPAPSNQTTFSGGMPLVEVGCCKTYTPTAEDIGYALKFECVVVNADTKRAVGHTSTILTSRVIPAPCPNPRMLIPVSGTDHGARLASSAGSFTVLSYNILCESSAHGFLYSYCPSWALSWSYRRQNLLREIVGYGADVVCLQEVQSDHFDNFFAPELDKHGYEALYKRKTNEVNNTSTIDGCATFFRRDRFSLVKKYDVEFNKAALALVEAIVPSNQQKLASKRVVKDNIALIVVLEAKFHMQPVDVSEKHQLLCVANTHVSMVEDLKDVKLWQVHTLLKGLEKIASSQPIPLILCGDFNSLPGSAAHSLLATGKVIPSHQDLVIDPFRILSPFAKLTHPLPLESAYSFFMKMGEGHGVDQHRRRMNHTMYEPLFTSCTREFIGTYDYIFYTADMLAVEGLLELLDEEPLRKDTALPSPEWSSDHIALLVEFRCIPKKDVHMTSVNP